MNDSQLNFNNFLIYNSRFDFFLKHCKHGNILDIGNLGGIGRGRSKNMYLKFKSRLSSTSVFYGIDLYDPPDEFREQFMNQITHDIETGLPFEDAFFDTVYAGQILEHLKNPFKTMQEIYRVLKQEGRFIFDVPNIYSLSKIGAVVFKKRDNLPDPTHISCLTPHSLKRLSGLAGFQIIEIATDWKEPLSWLPTPLKKGLGSHLLIALHKR